MTPYRGKNATKRVREVFESGNAGEIARLFVPDRVVTAVQDAGAVYWKVWDLYWILAALRVGLVLLPENGYLHPDEFFQTAEVAAGDALKLQVERTWEFNVTSPLRSMVIPTALFGGPLRVFAALNALLFNLTGLSAITAYTVLVVPRLAMVALSFVVDYSVYQVCLLYQHSFNRCLVTLASSYVMLVYATRTLTNSIEMVRHARMSNSRVPSSLSKVLFPGSWVPALLHGGGVHEALVGDGAAPVSRERGVREGGKYQRESQAEEES